jgi:hypothetical protein
MSGRSACSADDQELLSFARENFRLDLSADSLALLGRLRLAVALDVQPHAPFDAPPPPPN